MSHGKNSDQLDISLVGCKYIYFNKNKLRIFTQLSGGPCSLIAIINALILSGKLFLNIPENLEFFEIDSLIHHLTNYILSIGPPNDGQKLLNFEKNIEDSLNALHKSKKGLDLNVYFSHINKFEFTEILSLLDVLGLELYHGWVIDPNFVELHNKFGGFSYNHLVEKICIWRESQENSVEYLDSILAGSFLDETKSQMTQYGLNMLTDSIPENKLCIFFRNDHFSTIIRRGGLIFSLVTDYGFQNDTDIVWETLTISGGGHFYNSDFKITGQSVPVEKSPNIERNIGGNVENIPKASENPGSRYFAGKDPQTEKYSGAKDKDDCKIM